MTLLVTKADGTKQVFVREKIVRTCLRMGATRQIADDVAEAVERRIFNGVETREILKMIFKELGRRKPSVRYRVCLRKALSLMKPKPDFEHFIRLLLQQHGYDVMPSQIMRGRCVDHELDAIAKKDGKTYIVEIKHHQNYHTPTGLDESRIARAVFEDLTEGFDLGLNSLRIDEAMIVCNTKFSQHAHRYAECRGIHRIGWNSPPNRSLQIMIEEKKLYPLSCLEGLDAGIREKLQSAGAILLNQLVERDPEELRKQSGIPRKALLTLVKRAATLLSETEFAQ
ncbi:MAG: restriction endonuclease [Candidatus Bathyarchaeota archaeon]|nr:MAG: restriction endonuclease [Candidatus Bathyarchaeota archaeon]